MSTICRSALITVIAAGLLAIAATPTMAHELDVQVTATCGCDYTITVEHQGTVRVLRISGLTGAIRETQRPQ